MLLSDAEVGAFVSGGLDSSLIAASSSKIQPLKLFTSNVMGKYSELPFSIKLSRELNLPLHISDYDPNLFLADLVKTTWYYESPVVVHSNSMALQAVAGLAKIKGVKVVLTGEGADELFLGYPRLLTGNYDKLIKAPFEILNRIYRKIPGLTRYMNLNKVNYHRDLMELSIKFEERIARHKFNDAFEFIGDANKIKQQSQSLEMLKRGLHSLLWRNDRMGMMHSIEARFPFLDEKMLSFAINLPVHYKIGKSLRFHNYKHPFLIDKYIVRKYARGEISKSLAYREKQGFPTFGNMNLVVKKDFFKNGFLESMLEWDRNTYSLLGSDMDSYLKAKLACLEIWGRLFVQKESIKYIEEKVFEFFSIKN
jgi:asparagine synthase (glutamine-hydrolysing)